jgi:hypothetical protein
MMAGFDRAPRIDFTSSPVVAESGTAVITGRDQDRVRAAIEALSQNGKACGITAELTDRDQVPEIGKQLAVEHADATLLVNAAGFFIPKAFSEYDEALLSDPPRATWKLPMALALDVERAFHPCNISTKETNHQGGNSHEGDRGDGPGCGNGRDDAGGAARAAGRDKRRRR